MTREERRAILGDAVVSAIHERVKAAPDPTPDLVEELRRIMTRPGGEAPAPRPLADERPASVAA